VEAVISKAEQEAIWSVLDELHYIFRHALLRETAYQMQVQARRQELHAVAVQALETVYHDEIALHYAELAYHADHADLVVKACDYYERAGEAAAQAYQNIRAAEYFTRALELSPQGEQAAHYRLLTKRELIHEVSGNREAREADLAALQDLAGRMDDVEHQAYVWMRQARYYYDGGDFPRAIEAAQKSIDLANTINASGTAALAHGFAAQALYRSGNHDQAIGEIEMGLEAARASGDLLSESMLYNTLALIYLEQGKTSSAEEGFQQSLALARQTHDLQAQMRPLSNLALLAVARGDFLTAKRIYEDSLATWRTIGRRSFEENDLANLGWVAGNMGEYGRARDYLERQLRLAREIGDVYGETYGSINLSGQLAALGDYSSASQQAEQALILARRTGDRSGQAWALTYMGHNHFALGEPGRAASSYQQALGIRRELTQLVLGMEPLAGLARSALVVGDLTAAQRYTNEILDFLRESGSFDGTDDPLRIYYTCYLVLASVGDSRSQALLETAHAQLMERAGKFQDEGTRQAFLKNVEINRLIHNAWEPPSG
jgi:tetratricopeptide (TPR) repeat protein